MEYQKQHPYFGIWQSQETIENAMRLNRQCKMQDDGHKTGMDDISAYRHVSNEIPTATHIFQGSSIHMALTTTL